MKKIIGRVQEASILRTTINSDSPELVAVYGRRRIGKTYLIRETLANEIVFEFNGSKDASMSQQLSNFSSRLSKRQSSKKKQPDPLNWSQALGQLTDYLESLKPSQKMVVFFDEFPWINTHKSGFLTAFEYWWNSWGTTKPKLAVVVCGSAAAWMIQHIVNNKGGLHNRITRRIRLLPFTLFETEQYLSSRNIKPERYQLLIIYMVMGGVPHYLKEIKRGESAAQAIDRLCFANNGILKDEFSNLYHSLFDDASKHLAVVKLLARNNSGLTRNQIIDRAKLSSGGRISGLLEELTESGFVSTWLPYDKKSKDAIYKLSDEFTHFHLKFMDNTRATGEGSWLKFSTGQSWRSWSGIAFERICLKHIPQLKAELGISVIYTEESAWRFIDKGSEGSQIDLIIERRDLIIHLCEMKFSESAFTIDKKYAAELQNKRQVFIQQTKGKKSVFITMITTYGLKENDYALQLATHSLTMDAIFVHNLVRVLLLSHFLLQHKWHQ